MKKIKIAFLSLLATCTIASCDFLEKEPYKIVPENYFQNEAEAQSFLTGIYSNLGQSTFYGGDYMVLAGGDDLEFYGGSTGRISNTGLICNNTTPVMRRLPTSGSICITASSVPICFWNR